jgi:hypothetical protein
VRWSLLLAAGCIAEPSPGVELKGRHVTVHADPAIPICAPAVALADRYVEDIATALGIAPHPIDYYLIDGDTGCGFGQYVGASCTRGRTVYANAWIHYHELVHAVDDTYPPALFVEGLAEALSIPSQDARKVELDRAHAQLDFDSPTFRARIPWQEYKVAGDFMRFLVERYGGARYHVFARSVLGLSDPISTRRAFVAAFDAQLDDEVAAWRAYSPASSPLHVPVDDVGCLSPIAPVAADTWRDDAVAADGCESGKTEHGTVYTQPSARAGFEVTTPGVYLVEATTDRGDQRGKLRSCAADVDYEYRASGSSRRFMAVPLVAGRHAIDLVEGTRAWSVARLGAIGETCDTAAIFAPPAGERWYLDLRGAPATWLRVADTRRLYGFSDAASDARMCWGPCDELHCESIVGGATVDPRGEPLHVVLGTGVTPTTANVIVRTTD